MRFDVGLILKLIHKLCFGVKKFRHRDKATQLVKLSKSEEMLHKIWAKSCQKREESKEHNSIASIHSEVNVHAVGLINL